MYFRYFSWLSVLMCWLKQNFEVFISFKNRIDAYFRDSKKKILLVSSVSGIVLFLFLVVGILFLIMQTRINEKLNNYLSQVEITTGIIVRYKDIQVNPYPVFIGGMGEVTIHDISASFGREQPSFFFLSEIKLKGKPGSRLTSLQITEVGIRGFTARLSMDMLSSFTDCVKLLAAFIPDQRDVFTGGKGNRSQKNDNNPEDRITFVLDNGKVYLARKITDLSGCFPVFSRCRISGQIDRNDRVISGQCTGVGFPISESPELKSSGTGNITCSFLFRPYYQTLSVNMTQFPLKPLYLLLPRSIKADSSSSLDARLSFHKFHSDPNIHIDLKSYVNHITAESSLIASRPVRFVSCGVRGRCRIDPFKKILETDEFLFITRRAPLYIRNATIKFPFDMPLFCRMTIETDQLVLQDLLDSIPGELIPHIKDARFNGFMNISISLVLDMEKIENTSLSVQGNISSFKVIQPPSLCDVRKIKSMEYTHKIRTKEDNEFSITVGPLNENFISLENAGWYIIEAVLTCEDGNFFIHNGFELSHINGAIRQNLKKNGFMRGGSTVSMQLIKNLFLSGEKTISRKCEEIMLTWWMEQEINKNRLLEVYLNIVEWGPGIFGIGPASLHYFHCEPGELTCTQATWLANILINPSLFYYMKTEGEIDEDMRAMIRFAMREMKKHGGISEDELNNAEKNNFEVYFPVEKEDEEIEVETGKNIVQRSTVVELQ